MNTMRRGPGYGLYLALAIVLALASCSAEEGSKAAPEGANRPASLSPKQVSQERARRIEALTHKRVNRIRADMWLGELAWDKRLAEMGRSHSMDMVERGFFSHLSPDGLTPSNRAERAGYECLIDIGHVLSYGIGENLGRISVYEGYLYEEETGKVIEYDLRTDEEIARSAVDAWMESPEHRDTITKDYWRVEGIGVYITGDGIVVLTQLFC